MEIREIKTFLYVAHNESFSKAADMLSYSQAAVTIQMKHLEKELGTVLFDRVGKQIKLTQSGKEFLPKAQHIMHEIEEAKSMVHNALAVKGELRIGTIESIGAVLMPELITKYHEKYPEVQVSIQLDSPQTLLENLNRNLLDMVYIVDRRIYDKNWTKVMEVPEKVVVVASRNHPLAIKKKVALAEVLESELILTEKGESYRDVIERYLAAHGIEITPFLGIGSTEFIVRYLKGRQGISFLPEFTVKEELDKGELVELQVKEFQGEDSPLRVWRQLIYHKDKWLNAQMRAFIEEME